MTFKTVMSCVRASALCGLVLAVPAFAEKVPLTILHTNDIHSHYKTDKGPFGLGGIARIATTIRRVRDSVPNSVLFDGGDWSEGQIYYNLDAGRTALEMMNQLGYDAAVVGNHDWLNGPDNLLKLFTNVPPKFPVLAANVDFSQYARGTDLNRTIQPTAIVNAGPLKIGVIGLVTYELIYDKWFSPVAITDPFSVARKLAAKLKNEDKVDLVVVISHNGMATNRLVAGLANIDIVIHAHDHVKLPEPVVVERNGKRALMVEAEHWGFYVGRLDLVYDTEKKTFTHKYQLIQQDDTIPDDEKVASMVRDYDRQLEQKYGNVFADSYAETKIDIRREGTENLYGNLLTDAYRDFSGADVAFEQKSLTSAELYQGVLNTSDIYNALTAIWNPITGKSWTLHTMKMTGDTIQWLMNLLLSLGSYVPSGVISTSGMHAVYDPMKMNKASFATGFDPARQPLRSIEIGGQPINPKKQYLVALPGGVYEAVGFLENFLGNKIDRTEEKDTGVEDWRILAGYLKKNSPLDSSKIARGGRFSTLQPDIGMYHDDVALTRSGRQVTATVTVRNMGETASSMRRMTVTYDKTPGYVVDDPNPAELDNSFTVPSISPGKTAAVKISLTLPDNLENANVPIYFVLDDSGDDHNKSNDSTWVFVDRKGQRVMGGLHQNTPIVAEEHDHL